MTLYTHVRESKDPHKRKQHETKAGKAGDKPCIGPFGARNKSTCLDILDDDDEHFAHPDKCVPHRYVRFMKDFLLGRNCENRSKTRQGK